MYVNTVYALQLASFDYQEGEKLSAGLKADGATVVSGAFAYSFTNSVTKNFNVTSSALNFSGNVFSSNEVPCTAWKEAKNPPTPPVPVPPNPPAPANSHEAMSLIKNQHDQLMELSQQLSSTLNQKPAVLKASTRIATIPASIVDSLKGK